MGVIGGLLKLVELGMKSGAKKAAMIVKVPVENGIMFPIKYSYEEKVADLAHETNKVSTIFVQEIADEAYRRHDLAALKVCYDYLKNVYYAGDPNIDHYGFVYSIIRKAQDIILHDKIGHPFALVESVVRHLC